VWTLIYFAPEIISFQQIAESGESPANLIQRVNLWRNLNGVRVGTSSFCPWPWSPCASERSRARDPGRRRAPVEARYQRAVRVVGSRQDQAPMVATEGVAGLDVIGGCAISRRTAENVILVGS
jgi:hypothetical protein